jgi:hypothetical protein
MSLENPKPQRLLTAPTTNKEPRIISGTIVVSLHNEKILPLDPKAEHKVRLRKATADPIPDPSASDRPRPSGRALLIME